MTPRVRSYFFLIYYTVVITNNDSLSSSVAEGLDSAVHTLLVTVTDGNDAPSFDGFVIPKGGFSIPAGASTGEYTVIFR